MLGIIWPLATALGPFPQEAGQPPGINTRGQLPVESPVVWRFAAIQFLWFLQLFGWFSGWVSDFNPLKAKLFSRGSDDSPFSWFLLAVPSSAMHTVRVFGLLEFRLHHRMSH